jgi:hypothetical protein
MDSNLTCFLSYLGPSAELVKGLDGKSHFTPRVAGRAVDVSLVQSVERSTVIRTKHAKLEMLF